jgi:molybdopterin-guanine dinucleotide biosynthesis protein B
MPQNAPLRPAIAIVGRSGAGKTTLIETLIPVLKARHYRVGTVKHHAHPGIDFDREGKDTWRHAQAGSDHVVIAAPDKVASIRTVEAEPDIMTIIGALMQDVDLVLTDGYLRSSLPKIEVVRAARSPEPLCAPGDLLALVTDINLEAYGVPCFGLDDVAGLADLIEAQVLRVSGGGAC